QTVPVPVPLNGQPPLSAGNLAAVDVAEPPPLTTNDPAESAVKSTPPSPVVQSPPPTIGDPAVVDETTPPSPAADGTILSSPAADVQEM
ncbi:hypothetical protein LTS18_007714, partial [Coniosporium uncinatum]